MHLTNFHFYTNKNYLYSKPVKGLQGYGLGYGFGFNGKEKDDETYGEGIEYDYGSRVYDSRLGRWLSLDPLQAKYPDLTPFNYVNNMPIIAIDPDGRVLKIVSTDPKFISKTFSDLQILTNKQLVLLRDGTVMEAHNCKNSLQIAEVGNPIKIPLANNSKPVGTKLITDAIDDNNNINIMVQKPDYGNTTQSDSKDGTRKGEKFKTAFGTTLEGTGNGSDALVKYDPNDKGTDIVNEDGTTGRPSQVGLAHELGHALQAAKGQMTKTTDPTLIDPDTKQQGTIDNEEVRNRKEVDNPIREEQNAKARAVPQKKKR